MTHHRIPQPTSCFSGDPYSRRWSGRHPHESGRRLPDGTPEPGKPIIVNCKPTHLGDNEEDRPAGVYLCDDCADQLQQVLADLPALLRDLGDATCKQTAFVQHGSRHGQQQARDEAPVDFNPSASHARAKLLTAVRRLGSRTVHQLVVDPTAAEIAHEITVAASRGQRIIDSPPSLWFYGACPECRTELYLERIDGDDPEATIHCDSCGYAANLQAHNRAQLNAGEDRMLTVTELVSAITTAGEVVTRNQIDGWIRRGGLPREQRPIPRWRDGRLVAELVYVYRLGDVRDLALQAEIRKASA
ncbi:hypothetical protein GCM10009616_35980 [Microlunatus lacustris]